MLLNDVERRAMDRYMEKNHPRCAACGYNLPKASDPISPAPVTPPTYHFESGTEGPNSVVVATCKCGHSVRINRKLALND